MLLITCPWCGPRAESEFHCGGEADIARPLNTENLSDKEWGDYLFMRKNPRGIHREQWVHNQGCRRWFMAERDTVTYEFLRYSKFGEGAARKANAATTQSSAETAVVKGSAA
ncbi:sarcosine oxidase subunit delta [Glaciimonas sp. PAMC28666]|uniref:sarcosine oxidase subunit delta n=1 Tax=Glaciimonas sp. PAMC28666 TaxID=2807626 RepID=UPI0019644753|nr:sarcosine oxidase subunit delta [Glaciimonas sp. PAMC28666]QRX81510.1 sarcosine oxidase subunit delta [Glaciimonas sp. PAMC28666]